MNENNVNQIEPTNTQPEDNGVQAEKTFTQEDVNRIVSERLAKERSKAEQTQQVQEDQRVVELTARENKLACREFLIEKDSPKELLDCIDTSNPEEFKTKAEAIYNAMSRNSRRTTSTPKFIGESHSSNVLDEAFSRDVKHTPKRF